MRASAEFGSSRSAQVMDTEMIDVQLAPTTEPRDGRGAGQNRSMRFVPFGARWEHIRPMGWTDGIIGARFLE